MKFTEVIKGKVSIKSNINLCFVHTIQWDDIIYDGESNVSILASGECELIVLLIARLIFLHPITERSHKHVKLKILTLEIESRLER